MFICLNLVVLITFKLQKFGVIKAKISSET